jgi:septal ring factor EnvC (AmiA/AmiB activator)
MRQLSITTMTGIFIVLFSRPGFALSPEETSTTRHELAQVNSRIEKLQQSLTQTQARQFDLQQQLQISETEIGEISQQMAPLNFQLAAAGGELKKTKKMHQIALSQLHVQQNTLAQQLRIVYQLGQIPSLKSLLAPDNKSDRYLYYYRYLDAARRKLVTKIQQIVTGLNANMAMINEQERTLNALLQQKHQQQDQLQRLHTRHQSILTELNEKTYTHKQELTALLNTQKALRNKLGFWS